MRTPEGSPNSSHPNGRAGRQLFVFLIRLPFRLPVPDGFTLAMELPGDLGPAWDVHARISGNQEQVRHLRIPFVSLKVWQHKKATKTGEDMVDTVLAVARAILPSDVTPKGDVLEDKTEGARASLSDYETVVEAVTQVPEGSDEATQTTDAFDRCIGALNRMILSYARIARDATVQLVSREQLDPVVVVLRRPIGAPPTGIWSLFVTGGTRDAPGKPFIAAPESHLVAHYAGLIARGHPLTQATRFELERSRAYFAGDFASVLIWAAVGQEVVLNMLLRLLLIEEGRAGAIPELFQTRAGLSGRLNAEYAPRLGGQWRTKDPATPVGRWWMTCQVPRGKLVHGGYIPSAADALVAIDASAELDQYTGDRLAEKRYRYPKTAYTRLGAPGLERRGFLSDRMRARIEQVDPELDDFWREATTIA